MITRVKRTLLTFSSTVAVYLLYSFVLVPFVEPSAKLTARSTTVPRAPARTRKLDHLLPPGSWELNRPTKIIETDQGTLLFEDYKPMPDGRLKLTRCTVIGYVEQGKSAEGNSERREIVLRAPDGAILSFD